MATERYDWVDAAKGLSIILVVMMYSAYNVGEHSGQTGVLHYIIGFATPFRMPEFFLISGLFLSRVIAREWRRYADRRVVHYLYFYAIWAAIEIVLKVGIATRAPGQMAHDLALAVVEPYGVLWFIYMLAVFSIAAKLLWQLRAPHWLVLIVAAGLQMTQFQAPSYIVTQFCAYFVFFYLGYVAAPLVFRLVAAAEKRPALAWAGIALWALVETALVFWPNGHTEPVAMHMGYAAFPPLHLVLAVTGAAALCVLGSLLVRLPYTDWLRWIGEHSLIVYLVFTLPMSATRIILSKTGLLTDVSLLSIAVLVVSIVAPVILYVIVKRTGIGLFLFERPRWARLTGTNGPARAELAPAE